MMLYYVIPTLFSALLFMHGSLAATAAGATITRWQHDDSIEFDRWLQQNGTNATNTTNATTATTATTTNTTNATNITNTTTPAGSTVTAPTMAPAPAPAATRGGDANTLHPTSSTCNFAAVKAGTCDFTDGYCSRDNVYKPPGVSGFHCFWTSKGGNFIEYNLTDRCYESVNDRIGHESRSSKGASGDSGYCTSGTMNLNFTTNFSLASVEITRNLTEPAVGTIHEISNVSECDDADAAANAAFYFAGSFCKDPCPLLYEINGVACTGTCTPCTNGGAVTAAWDCSNVDASLVRTCNDTENADPLELVLIYLRGFTEAPTASPVAAGGGVPAGGTSTMRPTLAPNTTAAPTKAPKKPSKSAATSAAFEGMAWVMIGILATFLML